MKMKTGPKVLLLAILFVGLGYWAGRGFPRTWQAVLHPSNTVTAIEPKTDPGAESVAADTSARVTELESRVQDLEKTVNDLKARSAARPDIAAPAAPAPGMEPATPDSMDATPAPVPSGSPFPSDTGAPSGRL